MTEAVSPAPNRKLARWPVAQRFADHRLALFGLATIIVLAFSCLVGPWLLPFSDTHIDMQSRFAAPFSGSHVFGTDMMGRDTLARLLMAGRISLSIGFSAMAVSMVIGVSVGLIAGFYGGAIGSDALRRCDALLSFHLSVARNLGTGLANRTCNYLSDRDDVMDGSSTCGGGADALTAD